MERVDLYTFLFEFGYTLIFGILGAILLFLHTSNDKEIKTYKKAKNILGTALITTSLFCLLRLLFPEHPDDFVNFWILVTYTLLFSWMTYATILFLIETPRYLTIHFLFDGLAPAILMIIAGLIGMFFQSAQIVLKWIFGIVFAAKCCRMAYVSIREYRKCLKDLDNFYEERPDIVWIKPIIYIALALSAATVASFYFKQIHLVYYLCVPLVYAYIVLKIINFTPKKIDRIRGQNATLDAPVQRKKIEDLETKVAPLVEKWIQEKGFCTPELTIKDVAAKIGTNQNYLSQYINNKLGLTFQVWLNTLRIEESKIILTSGTKKSIEEIGTMVGFSQIYNFSRWFRTVTGTTPLQYRKNK